LFQEVAVLVVLILALFDDQTLVSLVDDACLLGADRLVGDLSVVVLLNHGLRHVLSVVEAEDFELVGFSCLLEVVQLIQSSQGEDHHHDQHPHELHSFERQEVVQQKQQKQSGEELLHNYKLEINY
jgi:hypothetical protein